MVSNLVLQYVPFLCSRFATCIFFVYGSQERIGDSMGNMSWLVSWRAAVFQGHDCGMGS